MSFIKSLIVPVIIFFAAIAVGWVQAGHFEPMSMVLGVILAILPWVAFRLM